MRSKIPFGRIQDIPTITESSLIKERNMIWEVEQPGMDGKIRIPGCPVKIHGEPDEVQKASPVLGEDTGDVLKELLNMAEENIDNLRKKKVI